MTNKFDTRIEFLLEILVFSLTAFCIYLDIILTNDIPNYELPMDTMNDSRLLIDLCFENIEHIEKINTQETLDILAEKTKASTDEDNCKYAY